METVRKLFFIFIGALFVLGSAYGTYYFFKTNNTIIPDNQFTPQQTDEVFTGLERDMTGDINPAFPKNLIPKENTITVVESFSVVDKNQKKQYTFKYTNGLTYTKNVNNFIEKFSNGFDGFTISNLLKDDINQVTTFLLKNIKNEELLVTITNVDRIGTMIDITYIK